MVKIYATACEKDGKNFNTVPKSMQAKVRAQIESDGFVILYDGTVIPVEEFVEDLPDEDEDIKLETI